MFQQFQKKDERDMTIQKLKIRNPDAFKSQIQTKKVVIVKNLTVKKNTVNVIVQVLNVMNIVDVNLV
ncbi:hypothetical protein IMG5_193890 [Ichthyophthirius multifiliis]|uniref:Uncharacterized protein n=1 Tax=Ichthyophthirius multifiliis TaxID=5932 RepID=G0R4M9_ICHMU|nr:hypothetical protein IMG5_193890 [Ichthyophthirius multifiliis]EGR27589.1 hypothetical protein IMG5_193890 [Ichthyophthirius multifiliis]|eukprot:XP_004025041.1 hypothetical protein IMG5_193890 [Ichthyophthirius multifiliis]